MYVSGQYDRDEGTGTTCVFSDSDFALVYAWAERIFGTYRDDSYPIELLRRLYLTRTNPR